MTTTLRSILRTDWFGPLAIILVATIVMTAFDPSFLSPFNVQILLLAAAVNSVIAMSQMVIIAIGQMNLSIGAIGGLSAICFAGMMQVWGLPPFAAAAAALGIGALAGFANGLLIARTGISAFIITLASLSIFKGADLGITRAQPFYKIPESVKAFGNTTIFGPIPWLAVPAALVVAGVWYLLYRQRIGRYMLAVGGNANAAELSGVSIERTVIWAHSLSGFLAALAGVMLVARLQLGQPSIGDDWLILSFAAPVIGGAALAGGHVSVFGTLFGVVIVAMITQALVIFRIDPYFVQVVLGFLILWAVGVNRLREVRFQLVGKASLTPVADISLEARGIRKAFPGVLALQDVAITMRGGSIHALLGENGAGKSTLIKIITGVHRPDDGELRLNGVSVRFEGPRDAIAAGVGVVHQERNLIPRFSVGENILLERLGGGLFRPIDYDAVHAEARRWLDVLELDLDPQNAGVAAQRRQGAARRDRQGAFAALAGPAARRADRLADAAGGGGSLSPAAQAA